MWESVTAEQIYKIKINILNKPRHMKSTAMFLYCSTLAQCARRQLFNHESHTLMFAGINTRSTQNEAAGNIKIGICLQYSILQIKKFDINSLRHEK